MAIKLHDSDMRRLGREEGLAEGEAKGRKSANREIAKNMLTAGLAISDIERFTALSEEEILKLK